MSECRHLPERLVAKAVMLELYELVVVVVNYSDGVFRPLRIYSEGSLFCRHTLLITHVTNVNKTAN